MELIPALDLRAGRVVRLLTGDYGQETRYADDPLVLARRYAEAGARTLHLVDLDGARSGRFANLDVIERIAHDLGIRIQAGGGVRGEDDLRRLRGAGVDRCVVGSLAVTEPARVRQWLAAYGSESLCLALDLRLDPVRGWLPAISGWTEDVGLSLDGVLAAYGSGGFKHLLCTDISRDGTLSGPNLSLYEELVLTHPELAIQASGGVACLEDLDRLKGAGVAGAIVGKALLEGCFSAEQALATVAA